VGLVCVLPERAAAAAAAAAVSLTLDSLILIFVSQAEID
jgi:hypothetical protein